MGRVWMCCLAVSCLLFGTCSKSPQEPFIRPLDTPAWTDPGVLYLKVAGDQSDGLLLMNLGAHSSFALDKNERIPATELSHGPIYRFKKETHTLEAISPEAWDSTDGPMAVCYKQSRLSYYGEFTHDVTTKVLQFRGGQVRTGGPTVLATTISPNNELVATVAAEGPYQRGFFFLTSSKASGKRFHQIFRLSDATEVGPSVILEKPADVDDLQPCWSPDGRFIVYVDNHSRHVWIIEAR